jgi:hypothetical protein
MMMRNNGGKARGSIRLRILINHSIRRTVRTNQTLGEDERIVTFQPCHHLPVTRKESLGASDQATWLAEISTCTPYSVHVQPRNGVCYHRFPGSQSRLHPVVPPKAGS